MRLPCYNKKLKEKREYIVIGRLGKKMAMQAWIKMNLRKVEGYLFIVE
jgi:hypothetical protein